MPEEPKAEQLAADMRSRAGHYEILGETYAKFEFFEKGWNPYSRFLDVDKVDLILRRRIEGRIFYREIQVNLANCIRAAPLGKRNILISHRGDFSKRKSLSAI